MYLIFLKTLKIFLNSVSKSKTRSWKIWVQFASLPFW